MVVNYDFRDLFAALNASGARYLLVWGYAMAHHRHPRFTKDLDIWVEPSAENAPSVFRALQEFGAPLFGTQIQDLATPDTVLQIGVAPSRIDLLTSIDGVTFDEAWLDREIAHYGDQDVYVIDRANLIRNKLATGRPQDQEDARLLAGDEGAAR